MTSSLELFDTAFIEIAKSLSQEESFILKMQQLEGKKTELFDHILSSPNLFEKEKDTITIFLILSFIAQGQEKQVQDASISKILKVLQNTKDQKEAKLKM